MPPRTGKGICGYQLSRSTLSGAGMWDECGQATLEFLVVTLVVLAAAVGLAALAHLGCDGTLLAHAVAEASHTVGQPFAGEVGDVAFF